MTQDPVAGLKDRVIRAHRQASMASGVRVCVAFSGGMDSRVLLDVLAELRDALSLRLSALHVHHGLSPNADGWADFCLRECERLGVAASVVRVAVDRQDPAGLEAAARAARRQVLLAQDCDVLAMAHHQQDQAETLLFRLLRGTGVRGAGAMREWTAGAPASWRPLLEVPRHRLQAWAEERQLSWVEDESNGDTTLRRNFLRHEAMPVLRRLFPGADQSLVRGASLFAEASDLLDVLAEQDREACGGTRTSRQLLCALPEARMRNVLRWMLIAVGGQPSSRERLMEWTRQLCGLGDEAAWRVEGMGGALCLYRGVVWCEPLLDASSQYEPMCWEGQEVLPWGSGFLRISPAPSGEGLRLPLGARLACPSPGLHLRLPGRPTRSFKKLCQDAALPPWLRPHLPVLWAGCMPLWVGELGVTVEGVCATGETGVRVEWVRHVSSAIDTLLGWKD